MVSWPVEKAGPDGQVVATDIDTSRLTAANRPRWRSACTTWAARDRRGEEDFGLVHARPVLVHVPEREKALRSMINALRPGGRLLIEDADPALSP
ncbi:class I SAM-dependent methyltransferase [Streptomyces tricolor]|nr:class I SAM-dependent methyltransferase [Streptomyces tricolor]